jgi:pimeloyl-ACP methyl ester carboxylesterase
MDRSLIGTAAVVLHALDALQIPKVYAVGTSYGGALAMALAGLAPQRVARLVLAAPVNPWSEADRRRTRWLATAPARAVLRCFYPCLPPLSGYLLSRMYGDPQRIVPGTAETYAAPLRLPGTLKHLLGIIRTWHADQRELEQVLPRITQIPALLVWGDRDPVVPIHSAESLRRQFATAQLIVLPGAGHLPYEETPEAFNRAVCGFLAR